MKHEKWHWPKCLFPCWNYANIKTYSSFIMAWQKLNLKKRKLSSSGCQPVLPVTLVSQEVIQQLIVLFHIKAFLCTYNKFKYMYQHDRVSLLRKKLHAYLLYLSVDILVLGMQFSNIHACLSVVFVYYDVASELISFQFLFTLACSIICFFIHVTYTFI